MITLYTLKEIEKARNISGTFRGELREYFREIAGGIVGDEWEEYTLNEVGPILVIEDSDTVEVLDEYGLMQGSETLPMSLPEFATRVKIDDKDMLRIIWVCNDSFGLSVYYPTGLFGEEFDEYIMEFVLD